MPASATAATPRLLAPAEFRSMPWRNGGGHTTEIAVFPPGADLATFAWRASIADIEVDGPFSAFPGVDRTLVLLAGRGMRLAGAGAPCVLQEPFDRVSFAGEHALACELIAGPTRDFNLMVRRGAARGTLDVVRDGARTFAGAATLLCFAAAGPAECTMPGRPPLVVLPGHALLCDDLASGDDVAVRALAPGGAVLVCAIAIASSAPAA